MTAVSAPGLASAWAATRADARTEAVALAMIKQQASQEQALVQMLQEAAEAPPPAPAAPPGQGGQVDVRA